MEVVSLDGVTFNLQEIMENYRKAAGVLGKQAKVIMAISMVTKELYRAMELHGPMKSAHEGYAVLLEEYEELGELVGPGEAAAYREIGKALDRLWKVVRQKDHLRDKNALLEEAVQETAMGLRFIVDVCMADEVADEADEEGDDGDGSANRGDLGADPGRS